MPKQSDKNFSKEDILEIISNLEDKLKTFHEADTKKARVLVDSEGRRLKKNGEPDKRMMLTDEQKSKRRDNVSKAREKAQIIWNKSRMKRENEMNGNDDSSEGEYEYEIIPKNKAKKETVNHHPIVEQVGGQSESREPVREPVKIQPIPSKPRIVYKPLMNDSKMFHNRFVLQQKILSSII